MNYFLFGLIFVTIRSDEVSDFRKHYGLSFHNQCGNYAKSFKCMTTCKSIGYQIFRLNRSCKCTCHDMKTSTILPFFKWRTNGTTMKMPKTYSVQLYHVVGTLSPHPTKSTTKKSNRTECPTLHTTANTTSKSTTKTLNTTRAGGNHTDKAAGNHTDKAAGNHTDKAAGNHTDKAGLHNTTTTAQPAGNGTDKAGSGKQQENVRNATDTPDSDKSQGNKSNVTDKEGRKPNENELDSTTNKESIEKPPENKMNSSDSETKT